MNKDLKQFLDWLKENSHRLRSANAAGTMRIL